jgi:uncharacterized membrane protein
MGTLVRWLIVTLLIAAAVHVGAVLAAPNVIMGKAIARVAEGAGGANLFNRQPRVTPDSRAIVRPSPDLAYLSCAYDLSDGPVRIRIAPWDDYVSLSLFADNTDNFFTINDRAMRGAMYEVALVQKGKPAPEGAAHVVESPSVTGIALERRLAPNAERFALADAARKQSVCEPW